MRLKLYWLVTVIFLFAACQKEYSIETPVVNTSTFTFDGAPSSCITPVINGTYMVALPLSNSNTVILPVTVTKLGSYSIQTNTFNGIKFSASGNFTALGSQNVTLTGSGTPTVSGTAGFTPSVNGCNFSITISPAAPPAVFTYASTTGICNAPVISGTYTAGTALNAGNTIKLSVNVTVAGSYSITTNTANGVSFSGSGLLQTGSQTVILSGINTPAAAGTFSYTPTNGCNFPVVFTGTTTPPVNADCKACIYNPYCDGSWFEYNDTTQGIAQSVSDTLQFIKDTAIKSLTFKKFYTKVSQTSNYYNCTSGNSRIIGYEVNTAGGSSVTEADITILKETQPVNTTWTDLIINPSGQTVTYQSTIKEKSISLVVEGKTYPDVIHVNVVASVMGFPASSSEYYFAKGVGLIEAKITELFSNTVVEHRTLKNYFIP